MAEGKTSVIDLFINRVFILYVAVGSIIFSGKGGVMGNGSDSGCGVERITLEPGTPDGHKLHNLNKYVFPGTPNTFLVSSFTVNHKEWSGLVSAKFKCNIAFPYSDERKYICLDNETGILKTRQNSNFSSIQTYTRFEIIVKVYGNHMIIGTCAFVIIVKGHRTHPSSTVMSTSPTTYSSTKTRAPRTVTTKHSSISSMNISTANPSTAPSTTLQPATTIDPCNETISISESLRSCNSGLIELSPGIAIGNALHFRVFPFPRIQKISHLLIRGQSTPGGRKTLAAKVLAYNGAVNQLLKKVLIKTGILSQKLIIDEYLPENCTDVLIELNSAKNLPLLASRRMIVFISAYDFCFYSRCISWYQKWIKSFSTGSCAAKLSFDPIAQFSACFDHCQHERTRIHSTDDYYKWPRTLAGSMAKIRCASGSNFATRTCQRRNRKEPEWGTVHDNDCKSINQQREKKLNDIEKGPISASNASSTAEALKNITMADPTSLPPAQLVKVTAILEKLSAFAGDETIAEGMLDTMDNCLQAPYKSFREGQQSSNMSKRIVSLLSNVCEAMVRNKTQFTSVKRGFALAAANANKSSFKGVSLSFTAAASKDSVSDLSLTNDPGKDSAKSTVSIALPSDLLEAQTNEASTLVFIVYDQGKLFQQTGGRELNSKIISAEVRNAKISKLRKPIVSKFKDTNSSSAEHLCVWWDFSLQGGQGGWSTSGCWLHKTSEGYTTCHCSHLTNFAVLLGARTPIRGSSHQVALTIVSYIGLAISLAGVLFTLLSYTVFPKLRENDPPKILMNLCGALALLLIVFAIGVERTRPREGCQTVAFLLHYALLCVLSWSAVEGFNSYRGIVKPMKSEVQHMMKKALVFGWGIPLIFPIVGIAVWTDSYGDTQSCVVKGMPLYTMLIAPVGVVMVMNVICIISIMFALNKSSKMYSHNAIKLLHRIRIIVAFVLLFSLTWIFGFLVVSNSIVAFQYIFCVFNSLQGFFIFLFYCVRNENVRKSWKEKLHATGQRKQTISSSGATKKADSSFDSAFYNKTDSLRSDDTLVRNGSVDASARVKLTSRANTYTTT